MSSQRNLWHAKYCSAIPIPNISFVGLVFLFERTITHRAICYVLK